MNNADIYNKHLGNDNIQIQLFISCDQGGNEGKISVTYPKFRTGAAKNRCFSTPKKSGCALWVQTKQII